jgi:hypothetical protein
MTQAEPRQHHRLPTFYLAGFTPSGDADDRLFVWDFVKHKVWRARPSKVAKQRDFYRVEVTGVDPNYVERLHQSFESRIAPILKNIRDTHQLPVGSELEYLIQFIALLDVRGEKARELYRTAPRKAARDLLLQFLGDPGQFRGAAEYLSDGRATIDEPPSAEAVERFLASHEDLFTVSDADCVRGAHRTIGELTLRGFLARNWMVLEGGKAYGGFICTVSLWWSRPPSRKPCTSANGR